MKRKMLKKIIICMAAMSATACLTACGDIIINAPDTSNVEEDKQSERAARKKALTKADEYDEVDDEEDEDYIDFDESEDYEDFDDYEDFTEYDDNSDQDTSMFEQNIEEVEKVGLYPDFYTGVSVGNNVVFPVTVMEVTNDVDYCTNYQVLKTVAKDIKTNDISVREMERAYNTLEDYSEYNLEYVEYYYPVVSESGNIYAIQKHSCQLLSDINGDGPIENEDILKDNTEYYLVMWDEYGIEQDMINLDEYIMGFDIACVDKLVALDEDVAVIYKDKKYGSYVWKESGAFSKFTPFDSEFISNNTYYDSYKALDGALEVLTCDADNNGYVVNIDYNTGNENFAYSVTSLFDSELRAVRAGVSNDIIFECDDCIYGYDYGSEDCYLLMDLYNEYYEGASYATGVYDEDNIVVVGGMLNEEMDNQDIDLYYFYK